jgi:hypothetical protein
LSGRAFLPRTNSKGSYAANIDALSGHDFSHAVNVAK